MKFFLGMKYAHFHHSFGLSMEDNMVWGKGQGCGCWLWMEDVNDGNFLFPVQKEHKMFLL